MNCEFDPKSGLYTVRTRHGTFTAHTRDDAMRIAFNAQRRELQRLQLVERMSLRRLTWL